MGRRELRDEQQRPDAQQAEEDLEFRHACRVLLGSRHDKAARMTCIGAARGAGLRDELLVVKGRRIASARAPHRDNAYQI